MRVSVTLQISEILKDPITGVSYFTSKVVSFEVVKFETISSSLADFFAN